jgi:molybdopterin molybdotransferase
VIPVEEHLARCLATVDVQPPRDLPLLDALDCVLAQDVHAQVAVPGFANSAMDGYAVVMADVATASGEQPVVLPVAADVPAGPAQHRRLEAGTAIRVMTGAPVPDGCEAVVPVEWTDAGVEQVTIRQAPSPGQYLRRAGEDIDPGELVLRTGMRLTPRRIAVAAAVGRAALLVHPRPRVAVLSTGSELVPPGDRLGYGQIYDSNGYALVAAARELGAEATYRGFVGDHEDDVRAALHAACADADLVITSGGVSAGAYDPVKAVLIGSGSMWFGKVAMQPGMPQGVGTHGPQHTPVLTLPGNPVSSMVSFEVFARPMVRRMLGEHELSRTPVRAVAAAGWSSPAGKRQFVRAVLEGRDGVATVRPVGAQGSHLVADLAEATCLAIVPEDVTAVVPGDQLDCLPLERSRR